MENGFTGMGIALGVVTVSVLGAALYFGNKEAKEWADFSAAHNCRVTAKMDGSAAVGPTSNGQVATVFVPGKTAYTCDDGVTYWKSE